MGNSRGIWQIILNDGIGENHQGLKYILLSHHMLKMIQVSSEYYDKTFFDPVLAPVLSPKSFPFY